MPCPTGLGTETGPPASESPGEPASPPAPPGEPDGCIQPVDCPTPTYAAGTGSSIGSGGGIVETRRGRTPRWEPADTAALAIAVALGETLTGMNYRAAAGDATGAYLISNRRWAGFGGYANAKSAPPDVQDRRAVQLVEQLGGELDDVAVIASAWHTDVTTTDLFASDFAYYVEANVVVPAAEAAPQRVPQPHPAAGEITFPVLGPVSYGDTFGAPRGGVLRDEAPRCHEGTDIFGAVGQPALAPVDGVVAIGVGDGHLSGIALSVSGGGYRFNLAHLSAIAPGISEGTVVSAGQIVGYLGATGNAGVPHLHFEIRDGSGTAVPSFQLLDAAARRQAGTIGIAPWSSVVVGTATDHRVVSSTTGNGTWYIDDAGRVTATGDAALITPTGQTDPSIPYGTDAAG